MFLATPCLRSSLSLHSGRNLLAAYVGIFEAERRADLRDAN
jgi:hypothetical protein